MSDRSIVFLMYHELEIPGRPICQDEPGYSRYVLPEAVFRAQVEYLKANGWHGLNVSEALKFPEGHNVAITFDDGCETDLTVAAPILTQAGFGATFFVTCGKLGTAGYLSFAQLKELSAQGFEIGCHSMTHPYLTDLDESGLRREICDAKIQLEQIIGRPVEHFSCPGGRFDQRVVAMAKEAGYRSLSTSNIRVNSSASDVFSLGRVAMLRDISLHSFVEVCTGASLPRLRAQGTIRTAARKMLGNSIYDRVRATLLHTKESK
jgi:peptidoglycan/xylan/chitin deacetylase (PgdA/CDA1 family)